MGPSFTDSGAFIPPDTMGAVGPTQFLFSVNSLFRGYNKTAPHNQIWSIAEATFWGSVADPAGVTDAHVRYDRVTQRWFITQIDVRASANHLLLAVSSNADLSTTTWTMFQIPTTGAVGGTDPGCFADYDTPGLDTNAMYVGASMFGGGVATCSGFSYLHSNLYVLQKSSGLTSTLHFTSFFDVAMGTVGVQTIQGVDSIDSMATGYAVSVKTDENPSSHLNVWQIADPGTTSPTLLGPTLVAISPERGTLGGVLTLNNVNSTSPMRPMDDIDDRLFAAEIRNGHMWTAHNIAVDSSGNSNPASLASINRDAARWYDVNVSGLTLNQSGTVFDNGASGFLQYWMPTIAVSGQGHAAIGLNRANSATAVQAGAVGRLAFNPLGTMGAFSVFQNSSSNAYDDSSFNTTPSNRWGDFTYTSLDPCDDQTIWTTQEFVGSAVLSPPDDWQVAAEKLLAPPPATPSMASPSLLPLGASSVNVVITGTSVTGSGFYDTSTNADPSCRKRISATVGGGVVVNSVTYTDPTHITLNVSTVGATAGTPVLTVANPDGQVASAPIFTVGEASYLPAVMNNAYGGYSTTTYVTNRGATPAAININYYDSSGHLVGSDNTTNLAPLATWIVSQTNGHSFTSGNAGSAIVYSNQAIATFVNEFHGTADGSSYTGIPIALGASQTLSAPTIANNAYGGYTTGIGLINLAASAVNITVTYRDGTGATLKVQNVSSVAAGAYLGLYSGDPTLGLPNGFAGTATIASSGGNLAAIVNETGPGGQFSSYDAVPSGSTTLFAPAMLRNAYGGYNTGTGIQNTTGTAGTVTITYYNGAGTGTVTSHAIAANGYLGVYQRTDIPADGAYTARITSDVAIAAIVNEVAPSPNPAIQQSTAYNTVAVGSSSLHLPLVESAGVDGWSTGEGIMNTGSTATTVTVTYYDAATGVQVGTPDSLLLQPNAFWGLYQPAGGLPNGDRASATVTASGGGQVAVICNESNATSFMSYTAQ